MNAVQDIVKIMFDVVYFIYIRVNKNQIVTASKFCYYYKNKMGTTRTKWHVLEAHI